MKRILLFSIILVLLITNNGWAQCGSCQFKTANQVVNGDFGLGAIGFTSDYNYSTNLYPEGNYAIGTNPQVFHTAFRGSGHTTGSDNFMVVNGATAPGSNVWCQTVAVLPNTDYYFSTWVSSVHASNPALLQFSINGVQLGDVFEAPNSTYVWEEFYVNWNSGNNLTATICIVNQSTLAGGNDFGIDDISFASCVDYEIINRPLAGLDTIICSGGNVNLGVPGSTGFTTFWEPASLFDDPSLLEQNLTLENLTDTPITYTFTLNSDSAGLGCLYQEDVVITVNPQPSLNLGNDTTLCEGPMTLAPDFTDGSIFSWTNGSDQETIVVDTSGTYGLEVDLFGCTITDAIEITIDTLPTFDLGPDLTFCEGDSVTVTAPLAGTWGNGSTNPSYTSTQSEWINLEVVNGTCSVEDSIQVTKNALPVADLGPDSTLCVGPLTLTPTVSLGAALLWPDGSSGNNFVVTESDTIILHTTLLGCENSDTVIITIDTLPTFDLGPDLSFCEGDSVTVTAPLAGVWGNGSTNPSYTSTQSEWISLEVVNGTCAFADSIQTETISFPNFSLGPDTVLCNAISYTLEQPTSGLWFGLINSPQITVYQDSTISFTAVNQQCETTEEIQINFEEIQINTLPEDTIVCNENSLEVSINLLPQELCIWNDGVTNNLRSINQPGLYWVEKYTPNCAVRDTFALDTAPSIQARLPENLQRCEDQDLTYFYPLLPNEQITWQHGPITPSITLDTTGTYIAEITNNYCERTDTLNFTLDALPLGLIANTQSLCDGDSILISPDTVNALYQYSWSDGSNNPNRWFKNAFLGNLTITQSTCQKVLPISISVDQKPSANLPDTLISCLGEPITIHSDYAGTWSNGSFGNQFITQESEWHTLTVENGVCKVLDSTYTYWDSLPTPEYFPLPVCSDDQRIVPFTHPFENYNFRWQDNGSTDMQRLFGDSSGRFTYNYNDSLCALSGFITVTSFPKPNLLIPDSITICEGENYQIEADIPEGYSFYWEDDTNAGSSRNFTETGNYSIIATNGICNATDTCNLQIEIAPEIAASPADTICSGDSITYILPELAGYNIFWNTDGGTGSVLVQEPGIYPFTVSNNICEREFSFELKTAAPPAISIMDTMAFCENDTAHLTAQISSSLPYQTNWNNLPPSNNFKTTTPGWHYVKSVHKFCGSEDSVYVTTDSLPTLNLPPNIFQCTALDTSIQITEFEYFIYSWSDSVIGGSRTFIQPGIYELTVQNNTCISKDTLELNWIEYPEIDLDSTFHFCITDGININPEVTHFTEWFWEHSEGQEQNFTQPDTLSLLARNRFCESKKTTILTADNAPVLPPFLDTLICDDQILEYQLSTPYSYAWSAGGTVLQTTQIGRHYYTLENGLCEVSGFIQLRTERKPTINYPDSLICSTDSVWVPLELGGYAYTVNGEPWTGNGRYISNQDQYLITAENGICEVTDTFNLDVETFFQLDIGNDTTVCSIIPVWLQAEFPSNYKFSWNDGDTVPERMVTEESLHIGVIQGARCFSNDQVQITHIKQPEFTVDNRGTLCDGDSLFYMPNNIKNVERWQWSDLPSSIFPDRYFSEPGVYTLTAYNGPCYSSQDIRVNFQVNPFKEFQNQGSACEDEALIFILNPDPNYFYLFNGQIWTEDSIIITEMGNYPMLVNANGCSYEDTIRATFTDYPTLTLPDSVRFCEIDSAEIVQIADSGIFYRWTDGYPHPSRILRENGFYVLQASREQCTTYDTVQVFTDRMPNYNGQKHFEICDNLLPFAYFEIESEQFSNWENGDTNSLQVNEPGNYPFLLQEGLCESWDSIVIVTQEKPELAAQELEACEGETLEVFLELPDGYEVTWSNNYFGNPVSVEHSNSLTAVFTNGICTDSTTAEATFHPLPEIAPVELDPVCEGSNFTVSYPNNEACAINWTNSEGTTISSAFQFSGTTPLNQEDIIFFVNLTNKETGCSSDSNLTLPISQYPEYNLQSSYVGCHTPVFVNIDTDADSLIWEPNLNTFDFLADQSGWYNFKAFKGACHISDSILVHVVNDPPISLAADTFICQNETFVIETPIPVLWNTGETTDSLVVREEGLYYFDLSTEECSNTDSIYIDQFHLPEVDVNDSVACENEVYTIPESYSEYEIEWFGIKPNDYNELPQSGIYQFKLSGVCGDSIYNFRLEYKSCLWTLFLPSAFTPNADGTNELYRAVHEGFSKVELEIYDRWGEKIFGETGTNPGWDGTYQGATVKLGVYNVVFRGHYLDKHGEPQVHQELAVVTLVN